MGKVSNSLQLQTILIMLIICAVNGAPYSKYGRTCKDIGCLPRETCVMAYDTCSFNQQEGTNCGRYPTCQKRVDSQPPQQNSGPILNPAPENTRASTSEHSSPPRDAINPNLVFGYPSHTNIYPQMPPQQIPLDIPRLPDNRQPFPASPNQGGSMGVYQYPYHPDLTPPPNIFHIPTPPPNNYYNIYKTTQPSRSSSTIINNASLNLTLLGLLFLLIYRISNNSA